MIHTVKALSVVDEIEVYVFLEFPCFLYDPAKVGNMISGSSSFSKPCLGLWKFLVHTMLKTGMQNFNHDLPSMDDERIVQHWYILYYYSSWELGSGLTFSSSVAIAGSSGFANMLNAAPSWHYP